MRQVLQRSAVNNDEVSVIPPTVHEVLRSAGQPLDPKTRAFFEPRFGHDFSQVRVHTDTKAEKSTKSMNSLAYTLGQNIVLGSKGNDTKNSLTRFLLAHELTHVVQQGNRPVTMPLSVGPQVDHYEKEATAVSDHFLMNCPSQIQPSMTIGVSIGTIQKGWPVILAAAAAAAAAAGGVASVFGAKGCLEKCRKPMFEKTFGSHSPNGQGGFRRWYYDQTGAPVPGKAWDAFGHCFVACCGTRECGSFVTAVAGKGREFWREYIDSDPHDSYEQDTKNQTLGREYGKKGMDCVVACRTASLSGKLDLSAPITEFWEPDRGHYFAPIAKLSPKLKSDTDIRYWVNLHSPSSIESIATSEKIRIINRLLDGWVSKEDMSAIEKICSSVRNVGEMRAIESAISHRAKELDFGQREQLRIAIGRRS
jgi:hypothetical protein